MEQLASRILDVFERWLPRGVVQVLIGLAFWIGAVWVMASWPGIYGGIAAALMVVAGMLPIAVAVREAVLGYRRNRCPMGDTWLSRTNAIAWLTSSSGMFSVGAFQNPAARNLASHVIDDLRSRHPRAVSRNGERVNEAALRWYSARMVSEGGGGSGRIEGGVVTWDNGGEE